jgi:L-seryl-tRNA(Ser) seleniumtransferase
MTLAALSATLALYVEPGRLRDIPFFAMLTTRLDDLRARADAICIATSGVKSIGVSACDAMSAVGGGALPTSTIPSAGIALTSRETNVDDLASYLRRCRPPIVGRADGDCVILDLRTVRPGDDGAIIAAIMSAPACE